MTTNPQAPVIPYRHYFYDDATNIIYHTANHDFESISTTLIFVGSSNNTNPKAAAAFFMQSGKVSEGFRLKDYDNPEG